MHRLDLSDNDVRDEGALGVGELLSHKNGKKLTHLDLRGNNIGREGIAAIAKGLTESGAAHLRHLNLAVNDMSDQGAVNLAAALASQKVHRDKGVRPLHCLHISANGLSGVGVEAILNAVCSGPTEVDRLDLGGNMAELRGARAIAACLQTVRTLRWLELPHTNLEEEEGMVVAEAIRRAPRGNLTHLDLSFNKLNDEAAIELAGALQDVNSRGGTIVELNLRHNQITDVGGKALAEAAEAVRDRVVRINIEGNAVSQEWKDKIHDAAAKKVVSIPSPPAIPPSPSRRAAAAPATRKEPPPPATDIGAPQQANVPAAEGDEPAGYDVGYDADAESGDAYEYADEGTRDEL